MANDGRSVPDGLAGSFTNDPVEKMIGDSLTAAGFEWQHEGHPDRRDDPVTLDFKIVGGPHVEVKRFHTPRCERQLAQVENVILVQGIEAARWFSELLMAARVISARSGG